VAEQKDTARAPAEPPSVPAPVPLVVPQAPVVLKPVEAAVAKVSAPVPARANDMNLTGTVAQPVKAAVPVKVASAVASAGASDAGLVDLNKGSLEDLNTLDGAASLGRAIIRGRPYASVDDLVKKRVLRRTSFEKIKDQVTVQ
jgi:DNA uptake protein ComE-like DNA-binding protein